jgi:hypothetical protein
MMPASSELPVLQKINDDDESGATSSTGSDDSNDEDIRKKKKGFLSFVTSSEPPALQKISDDDESGATSSTGSDDSNDEDTRKKKKGFLSFVSSILGRNMECFLCTVDHAMFTSPIGKMILCEYDDSTFYCDSYDVFPLCNGNDSGIYSTDDDIKQQYITENDIVEQEGTSVDVDEIKNNIKVIVADNDNNIEVIIVADNSTEEEQTNTNRISFLKSLLTARKELKAKKSTTKVFDDTNTTDTIIENSMEMKMGKNNSSPSKKNSKKKKKLKLLSVKEYPLNRNGMEQERQTMDERLRISQSSPTFDIAVTVVAVDDNVTTGKMTIPTSSEGKNYNNKVIVVDNNMKEEVTNTTNDITNIPNNTIIENGKKTKMSIKNTSTKNSKKKKKKLKLLSVKEYSYTNSRTLIEI